MNGPVTDCCNSPIPDNISTGGYEDILNVLEKIEDELDGQDEAQVGRSSSKASTVTSSTYSSSTSSSSKSSKKNVSKVK